MYSTQAKEDGKDRWDYIIIYLLKRYYLCGRKLKSYGAPLKSGRAAAP